MNSENLPSDAFEAIKKLFDFVNKPRVILLAGVHNGESSRRYLSTYPNLKLYGFEPVQENFLVAREELEMYSSRTSLNPFGLSSSAGFSELRINSNNATHSSFDIGRIDLWDSVARTVEIRKVPVVTVDSICFQNDVDEIDLLHLDVQGAELACLQGATQMLENNQISIIRCEVAFFQLYLNQPLFWDIGKFLSNFGYRFVSLVDLKYRDSEGSRVVWADAIFLSNSFGKTLSVY